LILCFIRFVCYACCFCLNRNSGTYLVDWVLSIISTAEAAHPIAHAQTSRHVALDILTLNPNAFLHITFSCLYSLDRISLYIPSYPSPSPSLHSDDVTQPTSYLSHSLPRPHSFRRVGARKEGGCGADLSVRLCIPDVCVNAVGSGDFDGSFVRHVLLGEHWWIMDARRNEWCLDL
jgi:hypothetical protein